MIELAYSVGGIIVGIGLTQLIGRWLLHDQMNEKPSQQAQCKAIIQAKEVTLDFQNTLTGSAARAKPNERLKTAFGIDNCFITDDKNRCDHFRKRVSKLIHVREADWQDFAAAAKTIIQKEFETTADSITLFSLIQLVTMKMARKVMWQIDPETDKTNDDAIRRLAHEVNQQWLRSKGDFKPGDDPEWRFEQQHDLQDALQETFPNWNEASSKWNGNPLNLILPGYETMWRVVLRCFVEVTARFHPEAKQWKQVLNDFLHKATREQLDNHVLGFSAAILAKETLRLYPPTRRIYRAPEDGGTGRDLVLAADIEALHKDEAVWGSTANLFNPTRWPEMDKESGFIEYDVFMPFGATPFRCPAKQFKGKDISLPRW